MNLESLIVGKDYYLDRRLGMIGTYQNYRPETGEAGFKIKGSNFPYLKDRADGLVYIKLASNNILIAPAENQ